MIFLLDTNVISELIKNEPDNNVLSWFNDVPEARLFLSVLTLGEIQRGIERLQEGHKKNRLTLWFDQLQDTFSDQTFDIDTKTALKWGELSAAAQKEGKHLHLVDGLIGATALLNGAILVTRNTADFVIAGVNTLNPWD